MTILVPALATAFAAFCVWLGVRIINRRELWAKWTNPMIHGLPVKTCLIPLIVITCTVAVVIVLRSSPPHRSHRNAWSVTRPDLSRPATAAEQAEIAGLIDELQTIADEQIGLSETVTSFEFAPIDSRRPDRFGAIFSDGAKPDTAFTRLVELGPKALPQLLAALDDARETALHIRNSGYVGSMSFVDPPVVRWLREVAWPNNFRELNPRRPAEKKLLDEARLTASDRRPGVPMPERLVDYTIKVGDVCYVVIGQIVNRTYLAAQGQPTGCTCVTSAWCHPLTGWSEIADA